MSKRHVMSFSPDGAVEYTRNTVMSSFFGGEGKMRRVTEILKEEYGNRYYIVWLLGPYAGADHTRTFARSYLTPEEILETLPVLSPEIRPWERLYFDSYEAAVAHEIQVLNAMRKKGVTFGD